MIFTWQFIATAQSPASFFPYQVGDLWRYRFSTGVLAWTERCESIEVDTAGNTFIRVSRTEYDPSEYTFDRWYGIKDSHFVYSNWGDGDPNPNSLLLYYLDAVPGESWVVRLWDDSSGGEVAKVAACD